MSQRVSQAVTRQEVEDIFRNRAFAECSDAEKVEEYLIKTERALRIAVLELREILDQDHSIFSRIEALIEMRTHAEKLKDDEIKDLRRIMAREDEDGYP